MLAKGNAMCETKQWGAMTPRQRSIWRSRFMGEDPDEYGRVRGPVGWNEMDDYDDPGADYEVLKKVRETGLEDGTWIDFEIQIQGIFGSRGSVQCIQYRPGDYTHAAYLTLEGTK